MKPNHHEHAAPSKLFWHSPVFWAAAGTLLGGWPVLLSYLNAPATITDLNLKIQAMSVKADTVAKSSEEHTSQIHTILLNQEREDAKLDAVLLHIGINPNSLLLGATTDRAGSNAVAPETANK